MNFLGSSLTIAFEVLLFFVVPVLGHVLTGLSAILKIV